MVTEKFKVKIVGRSAKSMLNILRNSGDISFANDIVGVKLSKIIDGNTGKYVFPNEEDGYVQDSEKGNYLMFIMEDDSKVKIEVDEDSLIFEVTADSGRVVPIRETVLSFIDYEYGLR